MTLFGGSPVTPGPGGQTFPLVSPIIKQILARVDRETCTEDEAVTFAQFVQAQGDIVPPGNPIYVRQQSQAEINIDPALLALGQASWVLEFAGPRPNAPDIDVPPPYSSVVLTPTNPFYFSINIGLMLVSAPSAWPGGPPAYNRYDKVRVMLNGGFSWGGLDQPTWEPPPTAPGA